MTVPIVALKFVDSGKLLFAQALDEEVCAWKSPVRAFDESTITECCAPPEVKLLSNVEGRVGSRFTASEVDKGVTVELMMDINAVLKFTSLLRYLLEEAISTLFVMVVL